MLADQPLFNLVANAASRLANFNFLANVTSRLAHFNLLAKVVGRLVYSNLLAYLQVNFYYLIKQNSGNVDIVKEGTDTTIVLRSIK